MRELSLLENKVTSGTVPLGKQTRAQAGTVPSDSLSFQRLLDVISSILAEEYIMIAKQNPEVFLNNTPRLSARPNWMGRHPPRGGELRGCAPSGQGDKK